MARSWYVIHTYSGYENKIEKYIRLKMQEGVLAEHVFDVKIPSEEVVEVKGGKKKVVNRKFLPGYILVEMDLPDRGWKAVCTEIRRIQGVMAFVGSSGTNVKPQPISQEEVRMILQKSGEIKAEKSAMVNVDYTVGEQVRVIEGPFESFTGTIDKVNLEKSRLKVIVGIFGRSTPVEVEFHQVERV